MVDGRFPIGEFRGGKRRLEFTVLRVPLPGDGDAAAPKPEQRLVRYDLRFRRAEMTVQLNERDGSPMAWVCGALADGPGPAPPPDQALRVAEAAADLPLDAVLAGAAYDSVGGRQVFVAEWEHHQDGVPVERDYVRVMVSADSGRAFAVHRRWHRVDPDWTLR